METNALEHWFSSILQFSWGQNWPLCLPIYEKVSLVWHFDNVQLVNWLFGLLYFTKKNIELQMLRSILISLLI